MDILRNAIRGGHLSGIYSLYSSIAYRKAGICTVEAADCFVRNERWKRLPVGSKSDTRKADRPEKVGPHPNIGERATVKLPSVCV